MEPKEFKINNSNSRQFIDDKIIEIRNVVGTETAINALSGGVDSSVVTMLGHMALEDKLKTYFIDNGLMREGEPQQIVSSFEKLGIYVEIIDAKDKFFKALKGVIDPEEKREAITQTFYKDVFGILVRGSKAKYLLHGTIKTDVDETKAGIKRQHNIFEQIGIDPKKEFGYHIIEPLVELRKDDVREVAKALGFSLSIYNRPPFPGPALSIRVKGEVTPEKIALVRKATVIVEDELKCFGAFQYFPVLHDDKVTGIRDGKRQYGHMIQVRCWDSIDAITARPTKLPYGIEEALAKRITNQIPEVVCVTFNKTEKPPATIEIE